MAVEGFGNNAVIPIHGDWNPREIAAARWSADYGCSQYDDDPLQVALYSLVFRICALEQRITELETKERRHD